MLLGADPLRRAAEPRTPREYVLDAFDTVNLLGRWPGEDGKGAAWDAERAARAARRLPLRGAVVLLGLRVRRAYEARHPGLGTLGWGDWMRLPLGRAEVTVIPHPSGIVRNYNDPAARALAGRVLREAEALAKLGTSW
jgi:hypothetical protein